MDDGRDELNQHIADDELAPDRITEDLNHAQITDELDKRQIAISADFEITRDPRLEPTAYKRLGREIAMRYLYQHDLIGGSMAEGEDRIFWERAADSAEFADERQAKRSIRFARELVAGALDKLEEIDAAIAAHAKRWDVSRMAAIDRNIIRLGVYEMMFKDDIPVLVSINEAIEVSKVFGSDKSGNFINGVLNGLKSTLEAAGE